MNQAYIFAFILCCPLGMPLVFIDVIMRNAVYNFEQPPLENKIDAFFGEMNYYDELAIWPAMCGMVCIRYMMPYWIFWTRWAIKTK